MYNIITIIMLVFFSLTVKSQQVIDNGEFFNDKEESALTDQMEKISAQSTVQILIYTITDLEGLAAIDYTMDVGNRYGVGLKGINNGITILLSKNDRKLQLVNGYGLEWVLPDSEAKLIVDQMTLYFKEGKFYGGINKGLELIKTKVTSKDWKSYEFENLTPKENGKIFSFQYSNKTGDIRYKYAINTDPQFTDDFKIKLVINGQVFYLYYSKYMNELISKILTQDKIIVYFRLSDYNTKRIELLGIE